MKDGNHGGINKDDFNGVGISTETIINKNGFIGAGTSN